MTTIGGDVEPFGELVLKFLGVYSVTQELIEMVGTQLVQRSLPPNVGAWVTGRCFERLSDAARIDLTKKLVIDAEYDMVDPDTLANVLRDVKRVRDRLAHRWTSIDSQDGEEGLNVRRGPIYKTTDEDRYTPDDVRAFYEQTIWATVHITTMAQKLGIMEGGQRRFADGTLDTRPTTWRDSAPPHKPPHNLA